MALLIVELIYSFIHFILDLFFKCKIIITVISQDRIKDVCIEILERKTQSINNPTIQTEEKINTLEKNDSKLRYLNQKFFSLNYME